MIWKYMDLQSELTLESGDFPDEFQGLANDDVVRRMRELEQELLEFQESSKELEQALEEELQQLETQNRKLSQQIVTKDAKIADLNAKVVDLSAEVNTLTLQLVDYKQSNEQIISKLKLQLVAVEILNEDMVSHDRVLEHKLKLSQQFNNELLEKLALVENDLEIERDINAKHSLTISNLENANQKKRVMKRDSTFQDLTFADGTILDINEMLASEPPTISETRQLPKLGSLHMIQELYSKSDALLSKVGDLNSTLKSSTTTETHRSSIISKQKDRLRSLSNSPSVTNLSKLQRNSEAQKSGELREGKGPKVDERKLSRQATKTGRFRDIVKYFGK
ncbi:CIC11C00000004370 [Sungouiella intermedia]|uniref:CIC11C00000004370 n=1 Tax=Sungouiella intermedia TaxID=45354 RepID=A0A1L0D3I3_9ASCO|nr:CIC11C00000004370 [[Candida] intermedia]